LVFKKWQCVLEDSTRVPKHVGESHLMLVLINNVHLAVIINGVWCFTVPWFVYEDIQCIESECHVIWWTSHSSCAFSSSVLHYGYNMVLEKMVSNLLAAM